MSSLGQTPTSLSHLNDNLWGDDEEAAKQPVSAISAGQGAVQQMMILGADGREAKLPILKILTKFRRRWYRSWGFWLSPKWHQKSGFESVLYEYYLL